MWVPFQTVFEAPSCSHSDRKRESISDSHETPIRSRSQSVYSDRTRVYPDDEKHGRDAALMLRATSESRQFGRIDQNNMPYEGSIIEKTLSASVLPQETDLKYFAAVNLGANDDQRQDEGILTQFDMDVPVAYGTALSGQGVNGRDVVEVVSPPIVLLADKDDAIEIGLQMHNIAGRIDKDRVPCPRLCGGSFSPGIGGIVCFNNGEVRKMWSWYEQADPTRRRFTVLSGKGRLESLQPRNVATSGGKGGSDHGDSSVFNTNPQDLPPAHRQECPRTLQDLEDMTDHARFSQWRSDESSGAESSIDDESDESLDDFASGDEEGDEAIECRKRKEEKNFGDSQEKVHSSLSRRGGDKERSEGSASPRTPTRQKQSTSGTKSNEIASRNSFVGLSSDLVPSVYITHDQDELVFSGQSKELARGWMLGEWYTMEDKGVEAQNSRGSPEREGGSSNLRDTFVWGRNDSPVLPRPRSGKRAEKCVVSGP